MMRQSASMELRERLGRGVVSGVLRAICIRRRLFFVFVFCFLCSGLCDCINGERREIVAAGGARSLRLYVRLAVPSCSSCRGACCWAPRRP